MKPHQLSTLIPAGMIERWRKHYARATTYDHRRELRKLLQFIERSSGVQGLSDTLTKVPAPLPRTQIAQPDQVRRILDAAEPWFRCFLLCCADLGLRSGTAARVAPANYFPEVRVIRILTKGGLEVELPVSPALEQLFEQAPHNEDPTMPFWKLLKGPIGENHRYTTDTLRKRWLKLRKQCGLPPEIRLHDLRRTIAVRLVDTTGDIRAASHALGHQKLESTFHYLAHRDTAKLRQQLEQHWWALSKPERVQ